jgi:hypothetical protein
MSPDEASKKLIAAIAVTREDVARAKDFILAADETTTDKLAEEWLHVQVGSVPKEVDISSASADDSLALVGKAYGLRLAFYQAVWELVAACELVPSGTGNWQPSVTWRDPHGAGGLRLDAVNCLFPSTIGRPPLRSSPPTDLDLFLEGPDCVALHDGICEAVGQSLVCFRRGLYLPSIVMLAAGAEAAWIECGMAVAAKPETRSFVRSLTTHSRASVERSVR